jgi:hypothetical protein
MVEEYMAQSLSQVLVLDGRVLMADRKHAVYFADIVVILFQFQFVVTIDSAPRRRGKYVLFCTYFKVE